MKQNYIYVIDYQGERSLFCHSKFSLVFSLIRLISIGFYDFRVSRKIVCNCKK